MLLPARRPLRTVALMGYATLALLALALMILAAFPVGLLRGAAERRLSATMGRPVRIGSLARDGGFSLHPTIVVERLVVPQPHWAGPGNLARVERAELTLPILPLLRGSVAPSAIRIVGARLVLVRLADGRESWKGDTGRSTSGGGRGDAVLEHLTVERSTLAYRDLKRQRQFVVAIAADPVAGLRATGRGTVLGTPVRVRAAAPPVERRVGGGWPFRAAIDGPDLAMTAAGSMAAPLDTGRMTLDMTARASDLKLLDAIVEAGLFHTRPVRLTAHVEHDKPAWRITRLAGTIGRSTVDGQVSVDKTGGRTRIDGQVHAGQLDFDDLAGDAGRARAAALRAAIGDRLVPDTRIDIGRIGSDIALSFRADRLVSRTSSTLRSLSGRATIERHLLTVAPFTLGLAQGAVTGRMTVDQRGGAAVPLVRLDLKLTGSSVPALLGGGGTTVTGRLDARVRLAGRGSTIRAAVGASSGRIGVAARDGALPARIADALGFDAGRALLAGRDERAGLRCAIVGLAVRGGVGRVDPLVIDTSASRLDGTGTIVFPGETLAIRLTGAPKRGAVLRLPGSATMEGTIEDPHVVIPPEVKSVGNVFRAIGRAITGAQGPTATDADCGALAAGVLR